MGRAGTANLFAIDLDFVHAPHNTVTHMDGPYHGIRVEVRQS